MKKLEAKDLITIGIFTAIYFTIFFACGMLGYIPIMYALLPLFIPIICGIPYMLFLTKVKCFGMVTIMGGIVGGMMVITGHTFVPLCAGLICGLGADLIFKAGRYQSKKCTVMGYAVFSLWIMGMLVPYWIMRDTFVEMFDKSMGAEYTSAVFEIFAKVAWAFPIMCVGGGVIGAFLGLSVLKKHFKRAGIA